MHAAIVMNVEEKRCVKIVVGSLFTSLGNRRNSMYVYRSVTPSKYIPFAPEEYKSIKKISISIPRNAATTISFHK